MASGYSSHHRTIHARFPITQQHRVSAVSRKDKDEDRAPESLRDFLSSLKFDLAKWSPERKKKGLGTKEDLLAISD